MSKRKSTFIMPLVAAVVLAVVMALTAVLPSCKKDKTLSQAAQSFINLVIRIKTPITLDSAAEIEAGYVLYEFIAEAEKNDKTVKEHKQTLDGYKGEYDVLKAAKDEEEEQAKQAVLRERFENAVASLPAINKLTTENKADTEAALALYEQLSEQSKNDSTVKFAYSTLTSAVNKIAQLEREEHLAEIEKTATEFIEAVEDIGKVTLDSNRAIEDLLDDYENFTDEVKQFEGVAEAKQTLDEANAKYRELKDEDDIEKLLGYAEKLSPAENVTLENERDILNAETIYKYMSENAKAAEGIGEAYQVIVAARAKYAELFAIAEAERIQIFIAAANAVPTDIENVDISWFNVLEAASDAYSSLAYESYELPEVEEAFRRWNAAQTVFDQKGYQRIPMTDPGILFSGDNPPHIVLQNEATKVMTKPLLEFYNVSSKAELDTYAILWMHVYVNGEYQGKTAINFTDIALGSEHIISNTVVVNALKRLAAENENVVSGGNFSFAFSVEDRKNEYIPSKMTKVSSASKVYSW